MRRKAQAVQLDETALRTALQQQGIAEEIITQMVDLAKKETNPNQSTAPTTPPTPTTMNQIPTVMSHLNKATRYSAVWAEPGRQLGPNADIPSLAEASDDDIGDMEEEKEEIEEGAEEEDTEEGIVSPEEAQQLGEELGIEWDEVEFTPEALAEGIAHEMEHGSKDKETNITDDDPITTAKIAWVHLKEDPEYYTKLNAMEDAIEEDGKDNGTAEGVGEGDLDVGEESSEQKPVKRFKAMLHRSAITIQELQHDLIPQLEDQLFQAEAALQSLSDEENMVVDARDAIHEAQASLSLIKEKVFGLGDIDPVTYGGPEQPKQKGLLDKLFK